MSTSDAPSGLERRSAERVEVAHKGVYASIALAGGAPGPGKLTNIALNGGLFIKTGVQLPFKSDVRVEIPMHEGGCEAFVGRVVRRPSDGVVIRLELDNHGQNAVLQQFVDRLLGPDGGCARELKIEQMDNPERIATLKTELHLNGLWKRVLENVADDAIHQEFIAAALAARRTDLALARYRALKEERPTDPLAERYVAQLGTILTFCAFQPRPEREAEKKGIPGPYKFIGFATLVLFVLYIILNLRH